MSEISDMIQRLCPDGVEYRKLGEVGNINRGIRVVKNDLQISGLYPVFQNSLTPLGQYNQYNYDANTAFVISAGAAGDIGFSKTRFWAADDCLVITPFDKIVSKFIFYYLMSQQPYIKSRVRKASIPRLSKDVIYNLEIPVPPLEVQRKIVEVLDNFSELTAELTAELEARKKQYEYYRDSLLNFSQIAPPNSVKWMKLGEIGDVKMCKRVMKHQTNTEYGIPFYKIGTFGKTADAFISQELFNELKNSYSYPKYGDILISASGTIGRTVVYNGEDAYYQDSNIVWIDNDESIALNSYLKIIYQVIEWKVEGGTIKRLYNDNIKNTVIPIPPLSEQERIVSILDRFESLTTDLTSGLPAEIKARQQQYEYYRDQLLTFKRAN